METRYFFLLRFTLALTDFLLFNICLFSAAYLSSEFWPAIDMHTYQRSFFISNLIWVICTGIFKIYTYQTVHKLESIYRATWKTILLHFLIFSVYLFGADNSAFNRTFFIILYAILIGAFLISRFIGTIFQIAITKNYGVRKVVAILDMNHSGLQLAKYLNQQSSLDFVGFLSNSVSVNENGELVENSPEKQLRMAVSSGVEEVFVSIDTNQMTNVTQLIKEGEKQCVRLKFIPDFSSLETNFRFDRMDNFTVLCARCEPLEKIENRFKKRVFDIVISLGVILFIFSWLFPILAIIIKTQSSGPIFFKQLRSGRDNKPFWCYKFRSMHVNGDSDRCQAINGDKRITPIGRFMRRTSLDELPQFFNVLLGNMSVIGPRPHMLSHTEQYRKIIEKYMVRQFLKPGISGLAQINGFRGETKEIRMMEKRVEHDIFYMESWSLMLDLRIIFLTLFNVLKGDENAW
jgi:putative colanic acid biosynthesis UDP-glucose lipid carrier transferase